MRLILTLKPHYQHPIHGSSCRLWDCTDYTPVSFLSLRQNCMFPPDWTLLDDDRVATHMVCSGNSAVLPVRQLNDLLFLSVRCNACVNNISHSQWLISFEMVQSTDDSCDLCRCTWMSDGQLIFLFLADCCCCLWEEMCTFFTVNCFIM